MEPSNQSHGQPEAAAAATADLEQGLTRHLLEYHQYEAWTDESTRQRPRVGRVPPHVRNLHGGAEAYTPKFVSIGPIHHADETLRNHSHRLKVAYLHALIARRTPDPIDDVAVLAALIGYKAGVAAMEDRARAFYKEPVDLVAEAFVDMLVLDGCFLLEHMLNLATGYEDPLLHGTHWAPSQLHSDLIRFENQVPFFVLAELLALSPLSRDPELEACRTGGRRDFLRSIGVHCLLRKDDDELKNLLPSDDIHHLLHLYSLSLTEARLRRPLAHAGWGAAAWRALWKLPIMTLTPVAYLLCSGADDGKDEEEEAATKLPNIPSATDLQRVGIKFKRAPRKPDGGFMDVRLEDGDTLVIPMVNIEQFTAPQLQNLIALEQATPELPDDCSCYAFFMDNLVANPADVALLESEGILKSNLGSHKAVVTYFNKLCRGNKLELEGNYLRSVFGALMERNRNPMYAWIRTLRKKYFSSPWGIIAMVVTLFVFASTVLQTYISVVQYYFSNTSDY
ncbi:hypothetical protein E2562_032509 [Oryza meyeriana var. granulata]|uniref:Uncharacterized protein n=1 Tax=Oryza meyeriana var. granulata TaxID=110450 RepID=A0A6G1E643_9ORYZ|nr:hypothetical protein E2562_032509 [Oryza meyeriana var. granulata]